MRCACQPGALCADCAEYSCEPDEHYCPAWVDYSGDFACRCGLRLTVWEVVEPPQGPEEGWDTYTVWAASNDDAGSWIDSYQPAHDIVAIKDTVHVDTVHISWGSLHEKEPPMAALDRLTDALVADTLAASDAEILAEFREDGGDPEQYAAQMRAQFDEMAARINSEGHGK